MSSAVMYGFLFNCQYYIALFKLFQCVLHIIISAQMSLNILSLINYRYVSAIVYLYTGVMVSTERRATSNFMPLSC